MYVHGHQAVPLRAVIAFLKLREGSKNHPLMGNAGGQLDMVCFTDVKCRLVSEFLWCVLEQQNVHGVHLYISVD